MYCTQFISIHLFARAERPDPAVFDHLLKSAESFLAPCLNDIQFVVNQINDAAALHVDSRSE